MPADPLRPDAGPAPRSHRGGQRLDRRHPRTPAGRGDGGTPADHPERGKRRLRQGPAIKGQRRRGQYVVFLNNDTEVQSNWLGALYALGEADPAVAAVVQSCSFPMAPFSTRAWPWPIAGITIPCWPFTSLPRKNRTFHWPTNAGFIRR